MLYADAEWYNICDDSTTTIIAEIQLLGMWIQLLAELYLFVLLVCRMLSVRII